MKNAEKKTYLIENIGCDDTTICILELTQEEFNFLNNIFEKINENSSCGCQPKIKFDLETKVEKLEGYKDADDYYEKTNNYYENIKTINGNVYRIDW